MEGGEHRSTLWWHQSSFMVCWGGSISAVDRKGLEERIQKASSVCEGEVPQVLTSCSCSQWTTLENFLHCPSALHNYRSVALTSHVIKSLERRVLEHLKPLVRNSAQQADTGVEEAIIYLLHRACEHLEKPYGSIRNSL